MKTLNKKNLKTINALLFTIRTNENCRNDILKKDVQTNYEKAFANFLFWDTRLVAITLYENFGIAYFGKCSIDMNLSEKEVIISYYKKTHATWKQASGQVA